MADNTIANAIKFLKGEEKSLPATKTEGQVYFAYKDVGTAEKPSYTGAIYIDTPIGGTQTRIKMTANADIADKAFNDSAGLNIRETYLSSLGYTDDGKQTILIKGSGNNQTRIALPIASTTKSGIVTTDAQSFGGTKTFTTINSTNLTVTGSSGFNYSGIETATGDKARPVWFAYDGINGKPVVNTNFTYNPATQTLSVANLSGTADKANKDSGGQNIRNTYVKYKTIKFSATTDKVYLLEGNGAGSATATSGENISTAIIPAATDKAAGVITTGTQTFSGEKKFNNVIFVNDCLVGNPMKGTDITKLILLSVPNTNIGDTSYTTSVYFKALLKWICQNYPNKVNYTFIGRVNPNSAANASIYIYNTGEVDATSGLPKYSSGSYVQLQGNVYTFGTYQYAFYFRESLMSDSNYAGSASSGGAATSANKLNTNAGSAILPVYFSNGVPVACSTNLGVSITGNAASATKLTSSAGSATQPIYFKDGKPVATTYSLNATVKAGVSNRIAFYSGNNEISSASSLKYYTTTNNKKAIQTILRIWGSTYGNDINTTISGKASSLSWNDGGPQIQFSTSETGAQDGALIFTDHDSAGIGASFHFVSNQSEWSVVSKRFVAKTSVIIGQENHTANNQGYNLYVNGTEYINGILTAVGDCKFIAHDNEFNFVPTLKASTSVWFNYRQTGGQPTDGDFIINEYIFGNGANKALASIKEGLFSGAATYVRDSNNKTNNISVTYSKAGQASTSWLASWNEYELGRISPANITAGKATKLTSSAGSATQPIYFKDGKPVATTYSLNATVKAGVSNRIAFYSGNNEISSASSLKYYTTTNNKKAIQTILRIWGSTYGNDINTTISGKASSLSWNDGGPQIQFSTSETGAQDGALIFTDHDSAGIGASFHFVSNQSEWSVVSKRFVAKTSVIIGQENHTANNQGYNLYVNGTEYINGILTAVGDCKFIAHDNEFNFVPTLKASTSVWFNYRQTGGQPTDGDFIINEYIFGNGANKALASIKEGLFSGAATYVRDSNNKTNNISVTYSKAGQASTSWLASWNEYELGRISPANITAGKATKLATARTISLTGSVTGSGTFDGSGNLSITTSTNHSHSQYLPLSGGNMTGNITYGAKGTCYIGSGANDAANMVGGALNNLVIASWNGISFTTPCSSTFIYKSAVSIDCRNGVLAAASLRVGNGSGSTINFCTNGGTAAPGAKIVAYNDRIEFVFA